MSGLRLSQIPNTRGWASQVHGGSLPEFYGSEILVLLLLLLLGAPSLGALLRRRGIPRGLGAAGPKSRGAGRVRGPPVASVRQSDPAPTKKQPGSLALGGSLGWTGAVLGDPFPGTGDLERPLLGAPDGAAGVGALELSAASEASEASEASGIGNALRTLVPSPSELFYVLNRFSIVFIFHSFQFPTKPRSQKHNNRVYDPNRLLSQGVNIPLAEEQQHRSLTLSEPSEEPDSFGTQRACLMQGALNQVGSAHKRHQTQTRNKAELDSFMEDTRTCNALRILISTLKSTTRELATCRISLLQR